MTENIDRDLQQRVARAEFTRRAATIAALALFIFVIGVLVVNTMAIRSTQTEGTPTGRRVVALSETIESCVNPEGECFRRSQKRQAEVIAALNLGALYGAYCVEQNRRATLPQIKSCVQRLYAEDQDGE